jgi:hypothetical protein
VILQRAKGEIDYFPIGKSIVLRKKNKKSGKKDKKKHEDED